MNTLKFKIAAILIGIVLTGFIVSAQKDELTKELHHDLNVNEQTLLQVFNKFGNITINDHDGRDKTTVDIKITAKASSKEKAEKILKENAHVEKSTLCFKF